MYITSCNNYGGENQTFVIFCLSYRPKCPPNLTSCLPIKILKLPPRIYKSGVEIIPANVWDISIGESHLVRRKHKDTKPWSLPNTLQTSWCLCCKGKKHQMFTSCRSTLGSHCNQNYCECIFLMMRLKSYSPTIYYYIPDDDQMSLGLDVLQSNVAS